MRPHDIPKLIESLQQGSPYVWQRLPEWREAFYDYNKDNKKKLGMGCRPCYQKVLGHLITKYERQKQSTE